MTGAHFTWDTFPRSYHIQYFTDMSVSCLCRIEIVRRQVQLLAFESRSVLLYERNLLVCVGKNGIFVGCFEDTPFTFILPNFSLFNEAF